MRKIYDIIYLILKIIYLILKIIVGIVGITILCFFICIIGIFVYYDGIDAYKYRTKIVNDYLSRNIIIDRRNISGGGLNLIGGDDVRYTKFTDNKKYENKYIEIDDPSEDYFYLLGLEKYIGDNLVYDESKGNHFDKIEEYLEKNREKIFKIFPLEPNEEGIRIYFKMDIMYKLPNGDLFTTYGAKMKINNHIIKSLEEPDEENYVENKEKVFFKEKVKYEDIDWAKYIEYMEVYPVLYMHVESKDNKDNIFDNEIFSDSINSEKLLEIYKEMEKFYNKKTFNIAIKKDLKGEE